MNNPAWAALVLRQFGTVQEIEDRLTALRELSDHLGTREAEAKESLATVLKVFEGRLTVAAEAEQMLENRAEYFPEWGAPGRGRMIPAPLRWNKEKKIVERSPGSKGGRPRANAGRSIEAAFCTTISQVGSYRVTQAIRDQVVEILPKGVRLSLTADQLDRSPGGYVDRTCRNFLRDNLASAKALRDSYLRQQEARGDA
jgi:hypothetical protein